MLQKEARAVTQGYALGPEIHFDGTFAPTGCTCIIHQPCLLLIAQSAWWIHRYLCRNVVEKWHELTRLCYAWQIFWFMISVTCQMGDWSLIHYYCHLTFVYLGHWTFISLGIWMHSDVRQESGGTVTLFGLTESQAFRCLVLGTVSTFSLSFMCWLCVVWACKTLEKLLGGKANFFYF
jgi:hypothetical protein